MVEYYDTHLGHDKSIKQKLRKTIMSSHAQIAFNNAWAAVMGPPQKYL